GWETSRKSPGRGRPTGSRSGRRGSGPRSRRRPRPKTRPCSSSSASFCKRGGTLPMADKSSRNGMRSEPSTAVLALKPAPGPRPVGVRWEDNVATVSVRGDLDREALWAIDYTIGRAAADAGRIVLDLREGAHLDHSGVPELVAP